MRYVDVLVVTSIVLATTACGTSTLAPAEPVATSLSVAADSIELTTGETAQLSVTVLDQTGAPLTGVR